MSGPERDGPGTSRGDQAVPSTGRTAPRPGESGTVSSQDGNSVRRNHRGWMIFFLVVVGFAGLAFVFKLYEFFYDLSRQEGFRFAGAHLGTYLLVAAGFFLLLIYGFLKGHFADIEQPKYDLLEKEISYDRAEFHS